MDPSWDLSSKWSEWGFLDALRGLSSEASAGIEKGHEHQEE